VAFFEYLQWHAHRQLLRCRMTAQDVGMPIGVYLDIAVGVDRDSAEAWWSQDYLVGGWSIGAPPDNWNLKGQRWGAPPPNATRMRETAYGAIRECLDANMRYAGAIRIDHILGFMRMFWVPEAGDAAAGAYIRYPLRELLAILALESRRHRCLVIGEDLGTVPDGLHDAMQAAAILSYRLLYFEHEPAARSASRRTGRSRRWRPPPPMTCRPCRLGGAAPTWSCGPGSISIHRPRWRQPNGNGGRRIGLGWPTRSRPKD
jgi:(1->4)-alpha-D-glucan 1-alpha-D-glucosylmutase